MQLTTSSAHRIVQYNYAPRVGAFILGFLAFGILWIERGKFNVWEVLFAAFTFLVYPHLAYLHARMAVDSKRAELNNLYIDSLLLGASTALIHFAVWPSVMLLAAICLNSTGFGYIRRLFWSLALFGAGAGVSGALTGYSLEPQTGPVVTAVCILGILGYGSWFGAISFVQNRNLVRTRNVLRSSEEQFRFIAENVGDMVSVLDPQGRFLYGSSSYTKYFGAEAIGRGADWFALIHPEDREDARSFLSAISTSASRKGILLRLVSADGSWRFMDCHGNPVRDDAGNIKSIVVLSHDIAASLGAERKDHAEAAPGIGVGGSVVGPRTRDGRPVRLSGTMSDQPQLRSIDEIRAYIEQELGRQLAVGRRKTTAWRIARQSILLLAVVVAYLQYYFLDIRYQTLTLPTIQVSVPAPGSSSDVRA